MSFAHIQTSEFALLLTKLHLTEERVHIAIICMDKTKNEVKASHYVI